MALAYQDFWPGTIPMRRAPGGVAWEPLAVMLERVNAWQATCTGRVINVETLLLPAGKKGPANSAAGATLVRWDEDHAWVQVVRVWYEVLVTPPMLPEGAASATAPESSGPASPAAEAGPQGLAPSSPEAGPFVRG